MKDLKVCLKIIVRLS